MQRHAYCASANSRQAFMHLVFLWVLFVVLTLAAAVLLSSREAKADVVVPLPKVQKVFVPAVLRNFTPSPSPALVEERCQSHLHPRQTDSLVPITISVSRDQRNAETREVKTVEAIKAYRQCVSEVVLEQMAKR